MAATIVSDHPQPSQYYDPQFACDIVKIKPGEFYATTQPLIIATVLGSCVSACIRDTARGGAGMNHFMLPQQSQTAREEPGGPAVALRYGVFAMESLINEFIKRGSQRRDLEAKVFGGASVMTFTHGDIGKLNAEFVLEYLALEGINIVAIDLGGPLPRRIMQFVDSGAVYVKYLARLKNNTIETREVAYARSLGRMREEVAVEMF